MRKIVICLYLFVIMLSTAAGVAHAQDRNSVTGFVFDQNRRPASEVYVELLNDFYAVMSRVRVQGTGMYQFQGLPQGNYYIRISAAGTDFEEQTKSVSLVPLSVVQGRGIASEQVDFNLKLKKRRGETATGSPGVVFAQTVPEQAKTLFESGVQDLSAKNDEAGLDKIKKSLEAFPDYFLALDRLGNEYVLRGHYQAGYLLLAKATTINPKSFTSVFGRGLAEFRLGNTDQAVASFAKSVELNKGSANGFLWLGIARHSSKKLPEALTALTKADELSGGTSAEVHWQLARVYKDQGKFARAADELELFLKFKPDAHNVSEIQSMVASLRRKS